MPRLLPHEPTVKPHNYRFWHPKIELWAIKKLRPSKRNARSHSKKQRDKLLAIIRRFGFINPIIIDENGNVIAGHLRREVAGLLGMARVPVIQITHLTDLEKRALALAENRIAFDAGWDRETLAAELGELAVLLPGEEIELGITGFDITETDLIIADHAEQPGDSAEDQLPDPGPPVSRLHDLWIMSGHRLYCGDARDPAAYVVLMRGESATMVFTDPPYNVSIRTHARGRSRNVFVEFAMASGYMKEKDVEMLKIFISKKGGYQGETGVGGWFRNTYWMPLGLFEEPAKGWFEPGEE